MELMTKKPRGRPARPSHSLTTKVVDYITRAKDYSRVGAAYAALLELGVMPHSKLLKLIPKSTAAEINEALKNALQADLIGMVNAGFGATYWPRSMPAPVFSVDPMCSKKNAATKAPIDDKALAEKVVSHVFSARQYQHMDPQHAAALECGLMPRSVLIRVARLPAEALDRGVRAALASGRIAELAMVRNPDSARKRMTTYYTMASDFVVAG